MACPQGGVWSLSLTSTGGLGAARRPWQYLWLLLAAVVPLLTALPGDGPVRTLPVPTTPPVAAAPTSPEAAALQQVDITVDGRPLSVPGALDQGVTLAPVSALASALGGAAVQTRPSSAQIDLGGHVLRARASQATLDVDGQPQALAVAPQVIAGQLYVPVRAVAATMGYALDWLSQTATVAIQTHPTPQRLTTPIPAADQRTAPAAPAAPAASAAPAPVIPYTQSDLELMGRVVHGEADGQPLLARIGIAAVILNRVRAPGFPKTIAGVIYAPGQFQAVGAPMYEAGPTASDLQAALAALHGEDPTGGALYFYVPALTDPSSWIYSRRTLVTLGVVRFAA